MQVKTLFSIVLKVLGIFFIKDIINSIIQTGSFMLWMPKQNSANFSNSDYSGLWIVIIVTLFYGIISWLLIFKSDFLISALHITKGFDDQVIPLNIHRSTILSISIIVIGGYMVANEIPILCRQLFTYYQQKGIIGNYNTSYTVVSVVKIIIGLLLMGLQRPLVNLIELKRVKASYPDNVKGDETNIE